MDVLQLKVHSVSYFDDWQFSIVKKLNILLRELETIIDDAMDKKSNQIMSSSYLKLMSNTIQTVNATIHSACTSSYTSVISGLYEINKKVVDITERNSDDNLFQLSNSLLQSIRDLKVSK